jgi:SAM domain (Sterile alpha motif)
MEDIATWLKMLSVGRYTARFAGNDISFAILLDLTDQDLKEIAGPSAPPFCMRSPNATMLRNLPRISLRRLPGSRRSDHIATYRCGGAPQAHGHVLRPGRLDGALGKTRCRRSAFHDRCLSQCVAETVAGFDGFAAKYRGDGVVIYSGIPALTRMMLSELCGRDWRSWKPPALQRFGSICRPGIVFWKYNGFERLRWSALDPGPKSYSVTFTRRRAMRLLRAHQPSGAWFALLALLIQIAVSFGHVHGDDLVLVFGGAWNRHPPLTSAPRNDPGSPSRDHDFCTICACIALAGSLVLPQPPAIVVAIVLQGIVLADRVLLLVSTDRHRHCQARAPPV